MSHLRCMHLQSFHNIVTPLRHMLLHLQECNIMDRGHQEDEEITITTHATKETGTTISMSNSMECRTRSMFFPLRYQVSYHSPLQIDRLVKIQRTTTQLNTLTIGICVIVVDMTYRFGIIVRHVIVAALDIRWSALVKMQRHIWQRAIELIKRIITRRCFRLIRDNIRRDGEGQLFVYILIV